MTTETVTLNDLHKDMALIVQKINKIEASVEEIHEDLHQVKPEYLRKLERIEKKEGKIFFTKEKFLHYLEHEL